MGPTAAGPDSVGDPNAVRYPSVARASQNVKMAKICVYLRPVPSRPITIGASADGYAFQPFARDAVKVERPTGCATDEAEDDHGHRGEGGQQRRSSDVDGLGISFYFSNALRSEKVVHYVSGLERTCNWERTN